jgi:hypothetical protein
MLLLLIVSALIGGIGWIAQVVPGIPGATFIKEGCFLVLAFLWFIFVVGGQKL